MRRSKGHDTEQRRPAMTTTFTRSVLTGILFLTALSGCGSDNAVEGTPEGGGAATETVGSSTDDSAVGQETSDDGHKELGRLVEEAFAGNREALTLVSEIDQDPMSADFVIAQSKRAVDALELVLAQMPEETTGVEGNGSEEYKSLREQLVGWLDYSRGTITEFEAGYDEFAELASAWDRTGPPPAVITDAIDGHLLDWIPAVELACAEFAVAAGVAPACTIGMSGGPAEVREAGRQAVTINGASFSIDPIFPVTDLGVERDLAFIDYGEGVGSLTIVAPPSVRESSEDDTFALPWPDDVETWVAVHPVELVSSSTETFGDLGWNLFHLRADDAYPLIENRFHPSGAWGLGGPELHIYTTEIDGAVVVAVLEIGPADVDRTETIRSEMAEVLATIVRGA